MSGERIIEGRVKTLKNAIERCVDQLAGKMILPHGVASPGPLTLTSDFLASRVEASGEALMDINVRVRPRMTKEYTEVTPAVDFPERFDPQRATLEEKLARSLMMAAKYRVVGMCLDGVPEKIRNQAAKKSLGFEREAMAALGWKKPSGLQMALRLGTATALLAGAGYACKKTFGYQPVPSPTGPIVTEAPTPGPAIIDIRKIPVTKEYFQESSLKGDQISSESLSLEVLQGLKAKAEAALIKAGEEYGLPQGSELVIGGFNLVDAEGHTQPVIFGYALDSRGEAITPTPDTADNVNLPLSAIFFYTESDEFFFVPPGTGLAEAGARMIPLGYWTEEGKTYFGFGLEMGARAVPVFEINHASGEVFYIDPYSGNKVAVSQDTLPEGVKKVLAALVPEATPEALPPLTSFETLNDARTFLESEEGAKWLPGTPIEEVELFPWNSAETWRMFSDLKSTGYWGHFVFLVPHTDRDKFSVIGVEQVGGKIVLNYIDRDGNPRVISFKGPLDLKDLLGIDFEKLFEKYVMVWPDLSYPNANSNGGLCTNRFRNPVPGITDGFACSLDGKHGHYFQSQNIVPENFK